MSHKRRDDIVTPKGEWETPKWLFDILNNEFHFDVDAACTVKNCKCRFGIIKTDDEDALSVNWTEIDVYDQSEVPVHHRAQIFFVNPPYLRNLVDAFMGKIVEESKKGAIIVALVPFSGSSWFQRFCMQAYEIRIIGRVKYIGYDITGKPINTSPMFDSCIVIFNEHKKMAHAQAYSSLQLNFPILKNFVLPEKLP